jgi:4a-hydroxytetrahydrobiopterin dehydratase
MGLMPELADRQCVPCRGGTPPLTPEQAEPLLAQLEGWTVEDGVRLRKTFRFQNFVDAVGFVDAITPVAEDQGHHPDLEVGWGRVEVILWTHKIGGLTESDFVMAAKIDRVRATAAAAGQRGG